MNGQYAFYETEVTPFSPINKSVAILKNLSIGRYTIWNNIP